MAKRIKCECIACARDNGNNDTRHTAAVSNTDGFEPSETVRNARHRHYTHTRRLRESIVYRCAIA
jgi:hypothetical protein